MLSQFSLGDREAMGNDRGIESHFLAFHFDPKL